MNLMTIRCVSWMASVLLILGACYRMCDASAEDKLITKLLENYNKFGRPGNESSSVEVNHGISLLLIRKYDSEIQSLTIDVWELIKWNDPRLSWKATNGEPESIRLPPDMIWMPDIEPYNGWRTRCQKTNVIIYDSGLCSWAPRNTFEFNCDPRNETHILCDLTMGSWSYDGSKLNLNAIFNNVRLDGYKPSLQFDILERQAKRNVEAYECCDGPIDVTYSFLLSFKL